MTDVTMDLDRFDAAVIALYHEMVSSDGDLSWPERSVFAEARKLAYERAASETGRSVQSLIADEDFEPEAFEKLYLQAYARPREIMAGRLERYLDSRTWEADQTHVLTLA